MNWNLALKYVGYAFVISIYGVFAWTGKADVTGFLAVLTGVLALLGGSHLASSAANDSANTAIKLSSIVPAQVVEPAALAAPAPSPAPTIVVQS